MSREIHQSSGTPGLTQSHCINENAGGDWVLTQSGGTANIRFFARDTYSFNDAATPILVNTSTSAAASNADADYTFGLRNQVENLSLPRTHFAFIDANDFASIDTTPYATGGLYKG